MEYMAYIGEHRARHVHVRVFGAGHIDFDQLRARALQALCRGHHGLGDRGFERLEVVVAR
ncbi:hypothetical protein D3C71_1870590 [compost metagenome]